MTTGQTTNNTKNLLWSWTLIAGEAHIVKLRIQTRMHEKKSRIQQQLYGTGGIKRQKHEQKSTDSQRDR